MKYRGFQIDVIGTNVYVSPSIAGLRNGNSPFGWGNQKTKGTEMISDALNDIDAYLKEIGEDAIEPDGRL